MSMPSSGSMALEQKIASIKEPTASHAFDRPAETLTSNLSTLANKASAT